MTATKQKLEEKAAHYHYGTGRRKTAVAQVRLLQGSGMLLVNEKETAVDPRIVRLLELVGVSKTTDVSAHVHGGGKEGQIGAIIHGIARALLEMNTEFRATLKKAGYLTRDSREKEREKPGLHGARRGPQFAKR